MPPPVVSSFQTEHSKKLQSLDLRDLFKTTTGHGTIVNRPRFVDALNEGEDLGA
jgi:hypothetical protein